MWRVRWGKKKQLVEEPLRVCCFEEERPRQGRCGGSWKGVWKVGSQKGHP